MKLYFDVIAGHKHINAFMVACDVFDGGKKQLGVHYLITSTVEDDVVVSKEWADNIINVMKGGFESQSYNVSFIGFRSLSVDSTYIRQETQSISNGERWILFKNMLEGLGYTCTTTEYMTVLSAKYSRQPKVHI